MAWLQLIIPTDESSADQISDALMDHGAVSVTLQDMQDQPVLEPTPGTTPMWSQTRVVGLFDASEDLKQVVSQVEQQLRKKITTAMKRRTVRLKALENKTLLDTFHDSMVAATFAQAGEFETAVSVLEKGVHETPADP